jgi:hypothetical protein
VRTAGGGRLDIAFTRKLDLCAELADYHGRLLYDAFKVVPVSFEASGAVHTAANAGEPEHQVRLAMRLTGDSQP